MAVSMKQLLLNMGRYDASDLHLKVGMPPFFRVAGELRALGLPPLTEQDTDRLLSEIIPPGLRERYDRSGDLDFSTFLDTKAIMAREKALAAGVAPEKGGEEMSSHYHEGVDRFRCNVYRAGGGMHGAIRRIKPEIPSFESLHLPPIYEKIADEAMEGLVLVVGVTGSGKSSTLACMIERINQTRGCNIVTIEDPVEYHFHPSKSIISQREIGLDVPGYKEALKFVVRQDPDVIFIGELRDHDTVLAAIQAAETGHLVFGSLHTADAMQAFSRIIEFFPQNEHEFLRSSLSNSLKAICAQRLIPANADATGGGARGAGDGGAAQQRDGEGADPGGPGRGHPGDHQRERGGRDAVVHAQPRGAGGEGVHHDRQRDGGGAEPRGAVEPAEGRAGARGDAREARVGRPVGARESRERRGPRRGFGFALRDCVRRRAHRSRRGRRSGRRSW